MSITKLYIYNFFVAAQKKDIGTQVQINNFNTDTNDLISFPSPEPKKRKEGQVQLEPTHFTRAQSSKSQTYNCKSCKEKYKEDDKEIWVDCGFNLSNRKNCENWYHAKCVGLLVKSSHDLDRVTFLCEIHRK